MDNMECNKMKPVVPKVKKKQLKDEMEHLKQAEKKKRRVEKALATSVAIRSELEKKKQRKKEEQQKLDEEGAAIAEAVALRVLLGEDSDVPCKIMLKKDAAFNSWECAGNIDLFKGRKGASFYHQGSAKCSFEGIGWVSDGYGPGYGWGGWGNSGWSSSFGLHERKLRAPYFEEGVWGHTGFSAGLIAAQAVSSLKIADDAHDTIVFNGMLRRW